jgi:multicomponent Na+:H+ antiporter subunit G
VLITGFLFFTAPVAAHAIGRSAYFDGVTLWDRTELDELRERYERDTHLLRSRSVVPETEEQEEGTPVSTR